jgi:hypothetical protein
VIGESPHTKALSHEAKANRRSACCNAPSSFRAKTLRDLQIQEAGEVACDLPFKWERVPRTMHGLLASVRYTVRLLLKSPGFTVTAVLILGFGIGANTAIFSAIDTVILKPLPCPDPSSLVQIFLTYQDKEDSIDYPDYLDICAAQHSFRSLAAVCDSALDLTGSGTPERLHVDFISASMFGVTGHPFILGRPFTDR